MLSQYVTTNGTPDETLLFKFILNNKALSVKYLRYLATLSEVRIRLNLNNNINFLQDQTPIDLADENEIIILDIQKEYKVYLSQNKSEEKLY